MALPTTAIEVELALRAWQAQEAGIREIINRMFPWQTMLDMIWPLPRPHTGDMVQMLDDLGIELPPDPRDVTFTWSRK